MYSVELGPARQPALAPRVVLVPAAVVVERDELVAGHAPVVRPAGVAVAVRLLGDSALDGSVAASTCSRLFVWRRCCDCHGESS